MNGYKSVNELSHDQFEELRQMMLVDIDTWEHNHKVTDSWYDSNGDFTDAAVKEFYKGIYFSDGDFLCTAA